MILFYILVHISVQVAFGAVHAPADFEALSKERHFIDKTVLIMRIFHFAEEHKFQIITCPAGFLKSTNLDMIKRFVQIDVDRNGTVKAKNDSRNFQLFNNPKFLIRKYNDIYNTHLAEYPVVHIKLDGIIGSSVSDIFAKLSSRIRTCYQEYDWLYKINQEKYGAGFGLRGNDLERRDLTFMRDIFQSQELKVAVIAESIYKLVKILCSYFYKKVIVMIDDYDAPIIETVVNTEHDLDLSLVKCFMDEVLGKLFEPEMCNFIKYIFVFGTNSVPLTEETNNTAFRHFLGNHPFGYHFAFTKEELSAKLQELEYPPLTYREVNAKKGGYQLKELRQTVCKPDSIVRFFKNQSTVIPANSWIDSGSLSSLSMFLNNTEIRSKVEELLNVGNVTFEVIRPIELSHYQKLSEIIRGSAEVDDFDINVFFTILLENGYLAYIENSKVFYGYFAQKEKILRFKIPNDEVFEEFKKYHSLYKQS